MTVNYTHHRPVMPNFSSRSNYIAKGWSNPTQHEPGTAGINVDSYSFSNNKKDTKSGVTASGMTAGNAGLQVSSNSSATKDFHPADFTDASFNVNGIGNTAFNSEISSYANRSKRDFSIGSASHGGGVVSGGELHINGGTNVTA
jgi:hypothetical protein